MNYIIRSYQHKDFSEVASWWNISTKQLPPEGLMIEDGTFILELNQIPALCLTVLKTQSKEICYLFGYVKNPKFHGSLEEYGQALWNHCFDYAKNAGYKRIMCIAQISQLKHKYERFGMTRTLDGVSTFAREL